MAGLMEPHLTETRWKKYLLSVGLFCAMWAYALGLTVFGPAVARMAADLGVSEAATGALSFWMSVGFLGATAVGWWIAHRIDLRLFAVLGAAGLAAGLVLVSRGANYLEVALGIGLFGIGGALSEIAGNATIANLYPENRAMALNVYHLMFGSAALAGPRFSGLLVSNGTGWRTVYLCVAAVALLPLPVFGLLRFPGSVPDPAEHPADDPADRPADRPKAGGPAADATPAGDAPVWRSPIIVVVALGIFFYVGSEIGTNNWAALFLQRTRGYDEMRAAGAVSDFWLALTAGRLFVIYLATRIPAEKLLLAMTIGAAAGSVLLVLVPGGAALWMMVLGGSFSGVFATLFAIGVNRFPSRSAAVSTVLTAAAGLGILLLAPSIGYANEWLGYRLGFALTSVYALALCGCSLWLAVRAGATSRADGNPAALSSP